MDRPEVALGEPLLIIVEEAADLLRLGRTRMFEFVMSGQIVNVKVGRRRLIPRKSLVEYVDGLINGQIPA